MTKSFFIVIFSCFVGFIASAQNSNFIFDHLTVRDGLSHPSVNKIVQDSMGFLWIATQDGLNKFDGFGFKVYKSYDQKTNGLTNNSIKTLFIDKKGILWVGTVAGGLLRYNMQLDVFESYLHDPQNPKTISSNSVYAICEGEEGIIWVGTYGGGLNKFNTFKKEFEHYENISGDKSSLSNNNIRSLLYDKSGSLWIGTDGSGLDLLQKGKKQFRHYSNNPADEKTISQGSVMTIVQDQYGNIWAGTYGGGLNVLNKNTGIFKHYTTKSKENFRLTNDIVWDLFIDKDSLLWVSTRGGGIVCINIKRNTCSYISSEEDNKNSINSNTILSVVRDNKGILWIGTEDKGLNRLNMQKQNFKGISTNRQINGILNKCKIASFYEEPAVGLWIGTYEKGLYFLNYKTNNLEMFNTRSNPALSSNTILSLEKDNEGNIWIGTDGNGIDLYNRSKRNIINYSNSLNKNSLSNNAVHCIYKDKQGTMWAGTWGGGLNKFNAKEKTFVHYDISEIQQKNVVMCIFEDASQTLWIGTWGAGLVHFDNKTGKFAFYLDNNIILSVLQSKDNNYLYIGTQGNGLVKMQMSTKLLEGITEKNGLSNDAINALAIDQNNDLWLTTNNGLSKISSKDNSIRRYNVDDGLIDDDFTPKTCQMLSDGRIILGTMNGVSCFNPQDLLVNTSTPEIIITNVYAFNSRIDVGSIIRGNTILDRDISLTSQIIIPYSLSVISFDFTAIELGNPHKLQFAYMLEGLDKDWTYCDSRNRKITYAQLPAGTYILKIKSTNTEGKWCENTRELKIIVKPPFWQTVWFFVLVTAFLFIVIFTYIRYKTIQIAKSKADLETKIKERTLELELRNEEIVRQAGKIMIQNEQITDQNDKLEKQQRELEIHKNNLEMMISQRTKELKQALKKADESDNLKTAFLTNMSNEIRTPMNTIIDYADTLNHTEIPIEVRKNSISQIKANSNLLLKMIGNIIELSKVQTGQISINKTDCSISEIFESIKPKVKNQLVVDSKKVDILFVVDSKMGQHQVYTDTTRLEQILLNLVDNALKHTSSGKIVVGCLLSDSRPKHPEIEFYVKDTGSGLEKDQYEAIFNTFTKIESKEKFFQGTGLGLSLSKNLVSLLGGRMWVESEEDKGSTIYFTIPFEQSNKKDVLDTSSWRTKKILIVDDLEINHAIFNEILKPFGINLLFAKNGVQAVDLCRQYQPNLILMDLRMPDISGFEAVKRIRDFDKDVPIIAQSAFVVVNERDKIIKSGFNDILTKPIDSQLLLKIIDNFFIHKIV